MAFAPPPPVQNILLTTTKTFTGSESVTIAGNVLTAPSALLFALNPANRLALVCSVLVTSTPQVVSATFGGIPCDTVIYSSINAGGNTVITCICRPGIADTFANKNFVITFASAPSTNGAMVGAFKNVDPEGDIEFVVGTTKTAFTPMTIAAPAITALNGDAIVGIVLDDVAASHGYQVNSPSGYTIDSNSLPGGNIPMGGYYKLVSADTSDAVSVSFSDGATDSDPDNAVIQSFVLPTQVCQDDFNCDCEAVSPWRTLADLRVAMLIRLGYPNQATNPPPGIVAAIDQHLRDAQAEIYRQVQRAGLRTERFYKWTMVPGQRYYGLSDNESCCDVTLDPEKITWVGFEDLNEAWYRMDEGIPPEYYTRANINFGWPTRFEIRSCIEIFPAPQAAYTLWIKGDFKLAPLVDAGDRTTIDDMAVFLLALANMKAERGAADAQRISTQATNYVLGLVAGTHGTKRYVPKSDTENPLTPPKFLPLGNAPP